MSRIGRMPIAIPAGVTVEIAENNQVTVKGPKGQLHEEISKLINVEAVSYTHLPRRQAQMCPARSLCRQRKKL